MYIPIEPCNIKIKVVSISKCDVINNVWQGKDVSQNTPDSFTSRRTANGPETITVTNKVWFPYASSYTCDFITERKILLKSDMSFLSQCNLIFIIFIAPVKYKFTV